MLVEQIQHAVRDAKTELDVLKGLCTVELLRKGVANAMAKLYCAMHNQPWDGAEFCRGKVERRECGGGFFFIVKCKNEVVQVAIPSESIKSFIASKESPPRFYVIPPQRFVNLSIYADVEFPLFWNFFIEQAYEDEKKVLLIGEKEQLRRTEVIFKESLLGPSNPNLCEDISEEAKAEGYSVDFAKEAEVFGKFNSIEAFCKFHSFKEDHSVEQRGITVRIVNECVLEVEEEGKVKGIIDLTCFMDSSLKLGRDEKKKIHAIDEIFVPPNFGLTFIGTSHGFDGCGKTTGFIVWIAGRGIVVDPPVGTSQFLFESHINPMLISDVILTHVHADHDAGLIGFIMDHPRLLTLHTFKVVYTSYMNKLRASLNQRYVDKLISFNHLEARKHVQLLGASWTFDFAFHVLPTLRFTVNYGGKSISYSADTFFVPEKLKEYRDQGVFSETRYKSLMEFNWSADIIIHESGVPPVHTPVSSLNSLPETIKEKLLIVHCSSIPEEDDTGKKVTHLRIPGTGMAETIVLPLKNDLFEGMALSARLLSLLAESVYLKGLSCSSVVLLQSKLELVHFPASSMIIEEGDKSDYVYFVVDGICIAASKKEDDKKRHPGISFEEDGFPASWTSRTSHSPFCNFSGDTKLDVEDILGVLVSGEVFGVSPLLMDVPRQARVFAFTDCVIVRLLGSDLKAILKKTPGAMEYAISCATSELQHQAFLQKHLSKDAELFSRLPPHFLHSVCMMVDTIVEYPPFEFVFKQGSSSRGLYVVRSGTVQVVLAMENGDQVVSKMLKEGDYFGEMSLILSERSASISAGPGGCQLLMLNTFKMLQLFEAVPAFRVMLEKRVMEMRRRNSLISGTPRTSTPNSVLFKSSDTFIPPEGIDEK